MKQLIDPFGRKIEYLRISVTDRCDLRCSYCMSEDVEFLPRQDILSFEEIIRLAQSFALLGVSKIRITGGEPLTWDMTTLTKGFKDKGMQVHIETSGAYKLTGTWDWICLSPKKLKLPTREVYEQANELKVIVYNKADLKFAEEQAAKVNKDCILYLQPEWSKRDKVIPLIVDYVMQNPEWKVSLQTHKYLNIP